MIDKNPIWIFGSLELFITPFESTFSAVRSVTRTRWAAVMPEQATSALCPFYSLEAECRRASLSADAFINHRDAALNTPLLDHDLGLGQGVEEFAVQEFIA